MVLEALINPIKAEREPWEVFFIGIAYSSIAIIFSLFLFEEFSSIVMISLTAMVSVPLIYGAIKMEEKKDLQIKEEKLLIKEHGKVLLFLTVLFAGFAFSFFLWYMFLDPSTSANLFQVQIRTIESINNPATGNFFGSSSAFGTILINNMKVLLFCLLFSFFYGFGAIFVLTWNASVFGAVIGSVVKNSVGSYFHIVPLALIRYSLHGIPEILAYFMAGLAGGIISIAVIRHDFGSGKFKHILIDSADMTVGAICVLVIAALIEVFISPMIL